MHIHIKVFPAKLSRWRRNTVLSLVYIYLWSRSLADMNASMQAKYFVLFNSQVLYFQLCLYTGVSNFKVAAYVYIARTAT